MTSRDTRLHHFMKKCCCQQTDAVVFKIKEVTATSLLSQNVFLFCRVKLQFYMQKNTHTQTTYLINPSIKSRDKTVIMHLMQECTNLIFFMKLKSTAYTFLYELIPLPANKHLLKVNNRNTRVRCEICSSLTIKAPERRQCRRSGVFIVNI